MNSVVNKSEGDIGASNQTARSDTTQAIARDDFDRDVWSLMGLPIDTMDVRTAAEAIIASVRDRSRLSFVTPNVNILVASRRDASLRAKILNSDLSLADGAPIVRIGKTIGLPVRRRCAGSDVFDVLRRRPAFPGRQIKVFFFGGRDGAAQAAHHALNAENRGLISVGHYNPGFGDVETMSSERIIGKINEANPDFIVVSLGFAKGQAWIDRNRQFLSAPVIAHLGAVVDFVAGGIKRAPVWVTKIGAEWLWRIGQEPSLWRRYLKDGAELLRLVPKIVENRRALSGQFDEFSQTTRVMIEKTDQATAVKLIGPFHRNSLSDLKKIFRNIAAEAKSKVQAHDIVLDLSALENADGAFWGMVLMLEKNLAGTTSKIVVAGARGIVQKMLLNNCFPYEQVDHAPAGVEIGADTEFAVAG